MNRRKKQGAERDMRERGKEGEVTMMEEHGRCVWEGEQS